MSKKKRNKQWIEPLENAGSFEDVFKTVLGVNIEPIKKEDK